MATNELHPRPGGGRVKKKMRLENGPVPQQHKDAGRALAEEMEEILATPRV